MGKYEDRIRKDFINKFVKRNGLKQMTKRDCILSMYKLSDEIKEEEEKKENDIIIDATERFINRVLCELNNIAEEDGYYFNKDNANLVSTVLYGQLEQLKEQKMI